MNGTITVTDNKVSDNDSGLHFLVHKHRIVRPRAYQS